MWSLLIQLEHKISIEKKNKRKKNPVKNETGSSFEWYKLDSCQCVGFVKMTEKPARFEISQFCRSQINGLVPV